MKEIHEMFNQALQQLISDDFIVSVGFISAPGALRRFLVRSEEVHEIRNSLQQGAITEGAIRDFVSSLMASFRIGQRFEHELALAALAVAMEKRPTDFAEEYLLDLAKLRLAEMSLCIRVARECVKHRTTIVQNKGKDFRPWPWPSGVTFREVKAGNRRTSDSIQTIDRFFDMRPIHAKT